MLRRLLGIIMLLAALAGIAIAAAGAVAIQRFVDGIGAGLDQTLSLTSQSLNTVQETLSLTKQTVAQVNDSIGTIQNTTLNLSETLTETRPLLLQINQIATHDVPDSIEAVQAALPQVSQVAGTVDETLRILNNFRIDQRILGIPIRYDLGINYSPDVPFNQTIDQIAGNLEGMPEQLRSMESNLIVADANLLVTSRDMRRLAEDLDTINATVTEIDPLLDDYIRIVIDANDLIRQARSGIVRDLETVKMVLTIAMIWLGLTQLAPLYLGASLLFARRDGADQAAIAGEAAVDKTDD